MKKTILTLLMAAMSTSAMAEWVKISLNENDRLDVYLDPSTIRKAQNRVKVWSLFDYKEIQTRYSGSFISETMQIECDCVEEKMRILTSTSYSGRMGLGNAVSSNNLEGQWNAIGPRTMVDTACQVSCGKIKLK